VLERLRGAQDRNTVERSEIEQIAIAGDDESGLGG
jgi:hypothetical protein